MRAVERQKPQRDRSPEHLREVFPFPAVVPPRQRLRGDVGAEFEGVSQTESRGVEARREGSKSKRAFVFEKKVLEEARRGIPRRRTVGS
mgnify:CR=1 FL=1